MYSGIEQAIDRFALHQMLFGDRLYVFRFDSAIPNLIRRDSNRGARATLSHTTAANDANILHPVPNLFKGFENFSRIISLAGLVLAYHYAPTFWFSFLLALCSWHGSNCPQIIFIFYFIFSAPPCRQLGDR